MSSCKHNVSFLNIGYHVLRLVVGLIISTVTLLSKIVHFVPMLYLYLIFIIFRTISNTISHVSINEEYRFVLLFDKHVFAEDNVSLRV